MRSAITKPSAVILSCSISFSIPMLIAIYWLLIGVHLDWAPLAVRIGVVTAAGALLLLWWRAVTTAAELTWIGLFSGYLGARMLSSLTAVNVARALTNWTRIALLVALCIVLARAFRNRETRKAFGVGALSGSLILSIYTLALYLKFSGLTLPTYERARILKATVLHSTGVALNPMAFSATFLGVLALCALRRSLMVYSLVLSVFAAATFLTGSRTPLVLLLVSFGFVLIVYVISRRQLLLNYGLVLLAFCAFVRFAMHPLSIYQWSAMTEGRVDVWTVAWEKFLVRPLTGFGAESWRDDLLSRIPGYYHLSGELLRMHSGGYHNAYLTLLAEEGLIVSATACILLFWAYRTCSQQLEFASRAGPSRWVLLFTLTFLTLRGMIEVPGLFGYGQDPAEYAAYAFLSLLISLPSLQMGVSFRRAGFTPVCAN